MNEEFKAPFNSNGELAVGNIRAFPSRRMVENDMADRPESQLIKDSRNGNTEAIAELFRRHYPLSIRVARRVLPGRDESSDAVQSAYLSAFRNFDSFRGDSSFKTWITRIVINQCLMLVRNSSRPRHFVSLDASISTFGPAVVRDKAPTPEDRVQNTEVRKMLIETIARLPRRLRETFTLRAVSGLSIEETAKALGLTVPATKTRLFRARSFMRSALRNTSGRANGTLGPRTAACCPAVLKKAS